MQQIPCLETVCGALHLHSKIVWPVFDPDIVSPHFSPRFADGKTPLCRLRHKLQLHPLAPLFVSLEPLPMLHQYLIFFSRSRSIFRKSATDACSDAEERRFSAA